MANQDSPLGFRLFRHGGKRAPTVIARAVLAGRTHDLMVGDAYNVNGDDVIRTPAGTRASGIVVGIDLAPKSGSSQGPESQDYIPAADAGIILGCEDPDAEFEVQFDEAYDADTHLGQTFDLINTDGNQALAQSRQELDASTVHASNGEFRLIGTVDRVDNDLTLADCQVVVRLVNPGPDPT